ncbi:solute carrier family 10 member 6-like isoform X2 [Homarus americanus]|nr:solute carrier family 10 member 6-like isoform X2 [Homarus americanus]XP_042228392.1 solute carrier family 10 member 6-like isoform X2 [Homarus americanus]
MENSTWAVMEAEDPLPQWVIIVDKILFFLQSSNLVVLLLGMGAATDVKEIWHHLRRPWGCMIGVVCQFVLLPAVGFGLCIIFQLPPYQALGVLILTCSPGGAFSNFFTYWVDGDLALSIMMTAISSMVAFGAMPLNLFIYTQRWTAQQLTVPYTNILKSLVLAVVPSIAGMIIRRRRKTIAEKVKMVCGLIGWGSVGVAAVLIIVRYRQELINANPGFVGAAALVPFLGFAVAYIAAKIVCFSHKVCRTVAIETGCQNMSVALSIMFISFTDRQILGKLVIFPILYGVCQLAEIFTGIAIFHLWRYTQKRRGDNESPDDLVKMEQQQLDHNKEAEANDDVTYVVRTSVPLPTHLSQHPEQMPLQCDPEQDDLSQDASKKSFKTQQE